MSTSFPGAIDSFTPNPTPTSPRNAPSLSGKIVNLSDSVVALETAVGVTNSAVATSLQKRVNDLEASNPAGATEGQIFVPASTLSGTAIMAAQAALPSTGGTIVLGPGIHTLDVPILLNKSGLSIEGYGASAFNVGAANLQWDPAVFTTAIAMADTTRRTINMKNFSIRPLATGNGLGTAIDASYFLTSVFDDLRVGATTRAPNIGILFQNIGAYYNRVQNSFIIVDGANCKGISLAGDANSNMFENIRIQCNTAGGIGVALASTVHSITLIKIDCESVDMIGVDIGATNHDINLYSCYFEAITIGLRIASGASSINSWGGIYIDCTTANIQDNGGVSVNILNARVQYAPYTYQALTGVAQYSLNGVRVPTFEAVPEDQAHIAWNFDPAACSNQTVLTNGTLYLHRIAIRYPTTITGLAFAVGTAAVTPVAGQNFLGLYNSAGTRVALTADMGASTTSTGYKSVALTAPYAAAAGSYWVAMLFNAATPPAPARGAGVSQLPSNLGQAAASLRFAVNGTALTALPASITPGSNSATNAFTQWVGAY